MGALRNRADPTAPRHAEPHDLHGPSLRRLAGRPNPLPHSSRSPYL